MPLRFAEEEVRPIDPKSLSGEWPERPSRHIRLAWLACAAFAWAALFGLLGLFWGAAAIWGSDSLISGHFGAGIVGKSIEQQALQREPSFIALLWITGILKICLGVVALALMRNWGRWLRRLWRIAAWIAGVGMILYGVGNGIEHLLMWRGVIATPAGLGTDAVGWHLALWDPWWLLGGVLFTLLAWLSRGREPKSDGYSSAR